MGMPRSVQGPFCLLVAQTLPGTEKAVKGILVKKNMPFFFNKFSVRYLKGAWIFFFFFSCF